MISSNITVTVHGNLKIWTWDYQIFWLTSDQKIAGSPPTLELTPVYQKSCAIWSQWLVRVAWVNISNVANHKWKQRGGICQSNAWGVDQHTPHAFTEASD